MYFYDKYGRIKSVEDVKTGIAHLRVVPLWDIHYLVAFCQNELKKEPKIRTTNYRIEELETTGISYYPGHAYVGTPVDAWYWETTENSIRHEHGLNRRVLY